MKREGREILVSDIVGSLCRMRLEEDYEREEMVASIKKHGFEWSLFVNLI